MSAQSATVNLDNKDLFITYFKEQNIRVIGDPLKPLFAAVDIGARIGDDKISRKLKTYTDKYHTRNRYTDKLGRSVEMSFLTERGLYKYLLQSTRPEAEAFQDWVYDRLCEIRLQIVDTAALETKIAQDREKLAVAEKVAAYDNMDMLAISIYDDSRSDSDHIGLAEFYIARYIASTHFRNGSIPFTRADLPQPTVNIIYNIASSDFRCSQSEFQDKCFRILDQHVEKIKKI